MGFSPLVTEKESRGSMLYASYSCTTHDLRFLKSFVRNNWKVFFLRFDGRRNQPEDGPLPAGVTQIEWLGTQELLSGSNFLQFIQAFQKLETSLFIDVVVAGPIPTIGFICTQVSRSPTVLMSWASDLLFDIHQSADDLSRAKASIQDASGIIVDSKIIFDIALELGGDLDDILMCPWGIELEDFQPIAPRLPDGILKLLSLRSLEKIYDVETLINAFALLKNFKDINFFGTIVGDGSQKEHLLKLAKSLNLTDQIDWVQPVPESAIAQVLHAHDLYISTSRSDGSSISMLQALSTGQLVLVSDIPSNREWITDNWNGWLFEVGNSTSLATKIYEIATSQSLDLIRSRAPLEVQKRANWSVNQQNVCRFIENKVQS